MRRAFSITSVIILSSFIAWGQRPNNKTNTNIPADITVSPTTTFGEVDTAATRAQQDNFLPDTSHVYYFFANNPEQEQPLSDTLLGNYFQFYDLARQQPIMALGLGNVGTATRSALFSPANRQGFDVGYHAYDMWRWQPQDLRFYRQEVPIANLYYSQGTAQNDAQIKAAFSRNFSKGIHLSLDYNRLYSLFADQITLLGNYQYTKPRTRNTNLNSGIWYQSENGKYDAFLTFTYNYLEQKPNGGIYTDTILYTDSQNASLPNAINTAQSRLSDRTLAYRQFYHLNQSDSLGAIKRNYTLNHYIAYSVNYNKYQDAQPDTLYYQDPFLTDNRGLRHYFKTNELQNTVSLSTSKLRANTNTDIRLQNDLLELGILHRFIQLRQEPLDSNFNQLLIFGKWNFNPNEKLAFNSYAQLGLWGSSAGEYKAAADATFNFPKIGKLKASFVHQRYSPSLLQYRLFVSEKQLWENNFNKTIETSLNGTLDIPWLQVSATIGYHLVNNYIYWGSTGPKQTETPLSVFQLIINKNFKLGHFHLDNIVGIQRSSEDFIRLPNFLMRNSLYYEGKLFKKAMLMRVGADFSLQNSYYADNFNPLTGQFFIQDSLQIKSYPMANVFLSAKVQRFRIFLTFENVASYFTNAVAYETTSYPIPDRYFRFGIAWKLSN